MNKRLKSIVCTVVVTCSLLAVESSVRVAPVGIDVVSAATAEAPAPAPAAPVQTTPKTSNTSKSYTSSRVSTSGTGLLKLGSSGSEVKSLQTLLNNNGYKLNADGIFGDLTLNAVKDYQSKNGLTADGIAGPQTLAKLNPVTTTSSATILVIGSSGSDVKSLQTMLNNNGCNLTVDGIFGNLTLEAVKSYQSKNGLVVDGVVGPNTIAKLNSVAVTPATPAKPTTPDVVKSEKTTIKIGKAEFAAHGTKCFTVAVVAMAGDKVVSAYLDDYQVMGKDVAKGVPNSDADFGKNFPEGKVLASKRANAVYYSEHMKEEAKATTPVDKSLDAIQAFVKGKTIAELEEISKTNSKDPNVDAVSGATLVDTNGYIAAVAAAGKAASTSSPVEVDTAAVDSIKVGKVEYAAHGTKCFTVASVAMAGDKIISTFLDDYQVMGTDVAKGVPNSNADFGKNFAEGKVLASKRANAVYYSQHMKEEAKATTPVDKSLDAIQAFATGKTVSELEEAVKANSKDPNVDAVSGATLVDTNGYLNAIVAAAKAVK